jgi:DNA-binding GntR family transcriptional regulator
VSELRVKSTPRTKAKASARPGIKLSAKPGAKPAAKSGTRAAPARRAKAPAQSSVGSGEQGGTSLRDVAYDAIKHQIITCAFKPGEYLNEAYVSAKLGIGRTPVHQALDRLMLEDMVEVIPRKGVIVKPVSLEEVMQIIEVRLINEPYGVRLTAERADDTDLAMLSDILGRAREWTAVRNVKEMMLLDREFHSVMARATRNTVLAEILRRLQERSLRFWFISLTAPDHHQEVLAEHDAILNAIRRRDADMAEAAIRDHIESFRRNVARYL